jgi:hypothetical protein
MTAPYDPDIHGSAEEYIREHRPHRYATIARQVDIMMRLHLRRCTGDLGCDGETLCPRHARGAAVVDRYLRMKGRATP